MRTVDQVLFVARHTAQEVEEVHGHMTVPWRVLHNGVDLEHYCPAKWDVEGRKLRLHLGIPDGAKVFLFVGRLAPGKGSAEVIEAFRLAALADAHFIVAGSFDLIDCRDESYLERLKIAAAAAGRVHLVGAVCQSYLPAYYSACDIVVVPSIGYEGLPKVVTEALAMGKPVIATDRGGIWELLQEGLNAWRLDDPRDAKTTAALLARAASDLAKLPLVRTEYRPELDEARMIREFFANVLRADDCPQQ